MCINTIETAIVEKLQTDFSDFLTQGFPDKPQDFTFLHPLGAILVHYRGGNYSNTNSLSYVTQEKKLDFSITLITRNLRSHNGAYEKLEQIKQSLAGFEIEGCSKLTPTKENFVSETNGIWQYEILFSLTTQSVEIY